MKRTGSRTMPTITVYVSIFIFLLWRALFDVMISKSLSHKVLWPGNRPVVVWEF